MKRVAIIGYSHRLPGNLGKDLWKHLVAQRDLITQVDTDRWSLESFLHPDKKHLSTSYTFAAGSLGKEIYKFDADFFGISPREIIQIDPQQRLLLKMVWEAFEFAGIPPSKVRGSDCGVFLGLTAIDLALRHADDLGQVGPNTATGSAASIAANRISYMYDLRGPSMVIDTACSSSLVAFHQACQSILSGESGQALAGGINLHLHPYAFLTFSKASMLSPTGTCKPFDASANGYVRSEGGGIVLLKDYELALKDNDSILAVVAGSAVNTDGEKVGLTVPSVNAQSELLKNTYIKAGINPDDISYLEAHGTGTPVGDPIETEAIGLALGKARSIPLPIGSIKANIGHLETASGIAGLIKAILIIQNKIIPGNPKVKNTNPNIKSDEWNLEVVKNTKPIKNNEETIIGINSFGFGGANAHVILREHTEKKTKNSYLQKERIEKNKNLPLVLSAQSDEALLKKIDAHISFLEENKNSIQYYDLAWSSWFTRELHSRRMLIWSKSIESALQELKSYQLHPNTIKEISTKLQSNFDSKSNSSSKAVFVYSGNGCQWAGMGHELLKSSPIFQDSIAEIDSYFKDLGDFSILVELQKGTTSNNLDKTEIAQPTLFALQVGITRYLASQGVTPAAVIGHSVGEVAAAWASGAFTLKEATRLIYYRSHYQALTAGTGQMTAVSLSSNELKALIKENSLANVWIAGINSFKSTTLAGITNDLDRIESILKLRKIRFKRLDLNYPFHSPLMDKIEDSLKVSLKNLACKKNNIPFYSTVYGKITKGQQLDAEYWWRNIRYPVLFEDGIKELIKNNYIKFLEIGAHPILGNYIKEIFSTTSNSFLVLSSLSRQSSCTESLNLAISKLLINGDDSAQRFWFPYSGERIQLPNYPWQDKEYMSACTDDSLGLLTRHHDHPLLGYNIFRNSHIWENKLDTQKHPWLADHNIGEGCVFPGAGYVELALASAHKINPDLEYLEIENLEILSPLLIHKEKSKRLHFKVSSDQGYFSYKGCEVNNGENEWITHCHGRIVSENNKMNKNRDLNTHLPSEFPDYTLDEHLSLTSALGLKYGKTFQLVKHGWIQFNQVICKIDTEDFSLDIQKGMLLHPGVLDSIFQQFIHLLDKETILVEGTAFIPVKIERIQFSLKAFESAKPNYAVLNLIKKSSYSMLVDITIFNATGKLLAILDKVRFRSVPLVSKKSSHLDFLYESWTPAPLKQAYLPLNISINNIIPNLCHKIRHLDKEGEIYAYEVEPLLDTLAETQIQYWLSGDVTSDKNTGNAKILHEHLKILANQRNLAPLISLEEKINSESLNPESIWNLILQEYPKWFELTHCLGRQWLRLEDFFKTGCPASKEASNRTDIFYDTDSSNELASLSLLNQSVYNKIFHRVLGDKVVELLNSFLHDFLLDVQKLVPKGQRIHIAELFNNEPILSAKLFDQLDSEVFDLAFLCSAESKENNSFSCDPAHKFLNICEQKKSSLNEINPIQFLVVKLDDVHPKKAAEKINFIKSHLVSGAQILLIGHFPAFWLDQLKVGNPMEDMQATTSDWKSLLKELNFSNITIHPVYDSERGVFFIYAEAHTQTLSLVGEKYHTQDSPWFFICDETSSNQEKIQSLISELTKQDCNITEVTTEHFLKSLTQISKKHSSQNINIILPYFSDKISYHGKTRDITQIKNNLDYYLEHQTQKCLKLKKITNSLIDLDTSVTCWVLTEGAHARDFGISLEKDSIPSGNSVIWGFIRTLRNEISHVQFRLIDLPKNCWPVTQLSKCLLVEEQQEDELLLDQQGQRFAARLNKLTLQEDQNFHFNEKTGVNAGKGSCVYKLSFSQPGQLRNLQWYPIKLPHLKDDQVKVDIKATGLNFRDVMYTLGMLSDEAIENGFAGPTLGLEFSGSIVEVGKEVKDFKVGDKVVGFGPSSFSTQVVANTYALTKIPKHITYEAAATIPTVFFTVFYALKYLARLEPGERILIHGAAGGVGIAALQIARWIGAEIYATVGTEEKVDFLRLYGCNNIYNSRTNNFAEDIIQSTPDNQGVDVVLNSLAGEAINQNLRVLKPFGRFLELGKRDFYENTRIGLRPFRNNISYFGIDSDQLIKEKPELTKRIFNEMMSLFQNGDLHPLPYTAFKAEQIVEAFRYMQQARQIGKVIVNYGDLTLHPEKDRHQETTPHQGLTLDPNASYLVTGGLSGFGLATALWLAEKGAKHLILISLTGKVKPEDREKFDALLQKDISISQYACDITSTARLFEVQADFEKRHPKLKGVFHAATLFADGLAQNLSSKQIEDVLAPKIKGALNLHYLTKDLDYFVLYSSMTTFFGNPGQSNYVAANYWLENFAHWRRMQGLAATCVCWGAIDDSGFLARNHQVKDALQNRVGGKALNSQVALQQLEYYLCNASARATIGILELDWSTLKSSLPSTSSPRFSRIAKSVADVDNREDRKFESILATTTDPKEIFELITEQLSSQLSQILLIPKESIDADRSVYEMGFDSLMGVELTAAIEESFNVKLPVMALADAPSVHRLAEVILRKLVGYEDDDSTTSQIIANQHDL